VLTAKAAGATTLTEHDLQHIRTAYQTIIAAGHAANPPPELTGKRGHRKRSKAANLLRRLDIHADDVLRFTTNFAVNFDNYADIPVMPMLTGQTWSPGAGGLVCSA
jgi:hypothetical protein